MGILDWLFGPGLPIPPKCSREDYLSMSTEDQAKLCVDFHQFLKDNYAEGDFGYDTFKEIEYDQMVLSTIYEELKKQGKIRSNGYMVFRLK